GVAVGTLYNHFDTREALFAALMAARRAELQDRLDATLAASQGAPFAQQLEQFLFTASDHLEKHEAFLRILMEGEHMHGKTKFAMESVGKRTEELCARGLKQRALRADE